MADEDPASRPRASLEFVEGSVIQAIVPEPTESNFEERLQALLKEDEDVQSQLHTLPIRSSLFFGRSPLPPTSEIPYLYRPQMKQYRSILYCKRLLLRRTL